MTSKSGLKSGKSSGVALAASRRLNEVVLRERRVWQPYIYLTFQDEFRGLLSRVQKCGHLSSGAGGGGGSGEAGKCEETLVC